VTLTADCVRMTNNSSMVWSLQDDNDANKHCSSDERCCVNEALGRSDSLALLGYVHARLGEHSRALQMLEQLKAASREHFVPSFFFALVYAGLEDKDQAFSWLEKGCEERYTRFAYLKLEALWDPLRSDPRFFDLVQRVGIPR
jgi:hypothetical protein